MALPELKFAVYYGTIRLDDGTQQTFTAPEIAALYNVDDLPYLSVPMIGDTPFIGGVDELTYVHLKPLANARYYDAKERYNFYNEEQWGDDFDARCGGKWQQRPLVDNIDNE